MSNVIDDLILSATKTNSGVVIEMTMDAFRRLISALNYTSGAWVATDTVTYTDDHSAATDAAETASEQTSSATEPAPSARQEQMETTEENTRRQRSENQEITTKQARELFRVAIKHPEYSKPKLQSTVGILPYSCYNKNWQFDIFGDGTMRTLNQIIELGRTLGENGFDRFDGDVFDLDAVAQMGISARFRRQN